MVITSIQSADGMWNIKIPQLPKSPTFEDPWLPFCWLKEKRIFQFGVHYKPLYASLPQVLGYKPYLILPQQCIQFLKCSKYYTLWKQPQNYSRGRGRDLSSSSMMSLFFPPSLLLSSRDQGYMGQNIKIPTIAKGSHQQTPPQQVFSYQIGADFAPTPSPRIMQPSSWVTVTYRVDVLRYEWCSSSLRECRKVEAFSKRHF